jgi:agmatinase
MISLALVALAAAAATARADQVPLAPAAHTEHAPHGTPAGTDYAQLFGTESQLTYGPSPWTRGAWNGLVTFGHARPVRCWGADEDVEYDVAVIGASARPCLDVQ